MTKELEVGQRVCVKGHGTSATEHFHGAIERFTKTQIVVKSDARATIWKFRKDDHRIIPRQDWGGYTLYTTCQRPKKK